MLLCWNGFYDIVIMWLKYTLIIHQRSDSMELAEELNDIDSFRFSWFANQ